jgi:hypothetical protein
MDKVGAVVGGVVYAKLRGYLLLLLLFRSAAFTEWIGL